MAAGKGSLGQSLLHDPTLLIRVAGMNQKTLTQTQVEGHFMGRSTTRRWGYIGRAWLRREWSYLRTG